jgi:hypothetical protein
MRNILFLSFILFLSACGGGGSGTNTPVNQNDFEVGDSEVDNTDVDLFVSVINGDLTSTLEVQVLMDGFGKTRLNLQGDQLWFQHINGEAPGQNGISLSPTYIDGVAQNFVWPRPVGNAFCGCESQRLTLIDKDFIEDIAIETSWSNSVRILQQAFGANNLPLIVEVENNSSVAVWMTFRVKPLVSAVQGDISTITSVDDLLDPLIDFDAREEYERDIARRARLDAILGEVVELSIPADPSAELRLNSVYRSEWMQAVSDELSPIACTPTQIFGLCYDISLNECDIVVENETNRCLNEYSDSIPGILDQPVDGSQWGSVIGGCMGDAFSGVLAEWKDPQCNI